MLALLPVFVCRADRPAQLTWRSVDDAPQPGLRGCLAAALAVAAFVRIAAAVSDGRNTGGPVAGLSSAGAGQASLLG